MKKRYKFLLSLILFVTLSIFCAGFSHASNEENPPSTTKTETTEGDGQGDTKEKIIITEEPTEKATRSIDSIKDVIPREKKPEAEVKAKEVDKKNEEPSPTEDKKPVPYDTSKDAKAKGVEKGRGEDKKTPLENDKIDKNLEKSKDDNKASSNKSETSSESLNNTKQTFLENQESEAASEDDYRMDYLENQKNDTLVLEVGPREDKHKLNEIKIAKKKIKKYEDPNANRIYIHLFGVFILALTALILMKFIRMKKA